MSPPAPAVGQAQYTAAELVAALTAVKADRGLTGEVSDDAPLRPSLVETSFPGGITMTPARCGGIAGSADFFGPVDGAAVAGLQAGDGQRLLLVSQLDGSLPEQQSRENNSLLAEARELINAVLVELAK